MISACLDGKAMIREGPTGDWIGTFLGHKGAVWSARLNATAELAATASGDFTAKIWNAETGACMHTLNHKHIVKTAIFAENSKQLFTGGSEKVLRVFDLEKPDAEPQVLAGHTSTVSYLSLTPDPNIVVSCGSEVGIKVWDIRAGEVVRTLATDDPTTSMTASNDGSVLSATAGKTVTMWDSTKFEKLKSFELEQTVDCVAFHPETNHFITGSDDELWVRAYDFESGAEIACNKGHHGPVRSVAYNPDGSQYASGSEDGTIRIWEKETSKNVSEA
jgi:serine-threonine kinase receptor-associated protein